MVVDGASWHIGEALQPPENIRLLALPFNSLSTLEKQLLMKKTPETMKSIVAWDWIINALWYENGISRASHFIACISNNSRKKNCTLTKNDLPFFVNVNEFQKMIWLLLHN